MKWLDGASVFEVGASSSRLLPLEGIRGVAVGLVFLEHYCTQFVAYSAIGGPTKHIALMFENLGNFGVELFFVLSGYLIYGILLRKRPAFSEFMLRRAQRLYPAFLVALVIGIFADLARPVPKIPPGFLDSTTYLGANLLFLPGLFSIEPLFTVNWSLSYEWWFYATLTLIFSVLQLGAFHRASRLTFIFALGFVLLALSASGIPNVPVRGLCLIAGMLLAETEKLEIPKLSAGLAVAVVLSVFALHLAVNIAAWISALTLALAFYCFAACAITPASALGAFLSWKYLRWFGNISYSYYLVHGFVVVALVRLLLRMFPQLDATILFWTMLIPVFLMTVCVGTSLFVLVEKRYSLRKRPTRTLPVATVC